MVIGSHHSKNNPVLVQWQIQIGAAKGKLRQISDRGEFDSFLAEIFQALSSPWVSVTFVVPLILSVPLQGLRCSQTGCRCLAALCTSMFPQAVSLL